MPDPREAVYDVLLAKKRRADEAREAAERAVAEGYGWEQYEEGNRRAREAYSGRRGA